MTRNINADLIKSISIFGVVYIHSCTVFGEIDSLVFLRDIFRFAVPCFIILWAYFFEKSYAKKTPEQRKKYLINRFIHLLRVFIIWSLFYFILTVDLDTLNFKKFFSIYFSGHGWSGQYFFIILFQLIITYPILRKTYNIKFLKILVILTSITLYVLFEFHLSNIPVILNKLGYRPIYFWVIYVFIGITLARNKIKSISSIFILSPLLIGLELYILRLKNIIHLDYITLGTLTFSILLCISFLKLKNLNYSEKLNRLIDFIGKNTLVIFVSNPLLIIALKQLIQYSGIYIEIMLMPIWLKICISLLAVLTVFSGTLIISNLLHKTKLIKFLG
ncbi:acyltransferase [uncultured Maribacter sp.]|uniref:acyltransferase n=1 Tax=uncultured Maribacter sp. TaxID=431308 RepID=UPI003432C2A4